PPPALPDSRAPAIVPPMSGGRGTQRMMAVAILLACALVAASIGPAGASAKKPKLVFIKGRVVSDHLVTPGKLETIEVSHLPPRARLQVFADPPPITPECGEFYFCELVRTSPAPGTPPYRASGRGRARLTFMMPSSYFVETNPFGPRQGHLQN